MKFRNQYDEHVRFQSNLGSRIKDVLAPIFDEKGVMTLEKVGEENLYDYIQSHKDSVDIYSILKRYQAGDEAVLSKVQGMYGDFTSFPATYAEALNAMNAAETYFMSLPVETRAKFGHSFQQFLASMDKPEFLDNMGLVPKEPVNTEPVSPAPEGGSQE